MTNAPALGGHIHRFGDNIDTDVILPGRYLAIRDPVELGKHCLEGIDPDFVRRVTRGDIVVGGRNFGSGSSREHAVVALKAAGVAALIVASAARIFFRNAINLGLPVVICPEAARELDPADTVSIDLEAGLITQGGRQWTTTPFRGEVQAILASGGLVPHIKKQLTTRNEAHG
jgi:3-isopropylmalate/(R)-2-methylmalate dehydratase small subunit